MKKKILLSVVCFAFALMSCLSLSACGKEKECTHSFGDWSVTQEATCETKGSRKHTCSKCNKEVSEDIEALGHDWGDATYVWATDNVSCTASHTCERTGCEKTVTETKESTNSVTTPATCIEKGIATYMVDFESSDFEQQTTTGEVAALGHEMSVTYAVAADNASCTATEVCSRIGCNHTGDTETKSTATPVVTPATCSVEGNTKYVYDFANVKFATQTKNVPIAKLAHELKVRYIFANDYASCLAEQYCERTNCEHVEKTETKTTATPVVTPATCTTDGNTKYVYDFEAALFETQTKNIPITRLGHEWGVSYSVSLDYATCTAEHYCTRDHCGEVDATATKNGSKTVTAGSCTTPGNTRWTYDFGNPIFGVYNVNVPMPAGHDMGPVEYVWSNDYTSCTATIACRRAGCDESESETVSGLEFEIIANPTCLDFGKKQTTAVFETNVEFETQYSPMINIPALGHDMELDETSCIEKTCTVNGENVYRCQNVGCIHFETEVVYAGHIWDYEEVSCEHGRSCTECEATEPAAEHDYGLPIEVEATCEVDGSITYVCSICNHTEVETIEAFGHEIDEEDRQEEQIGETCEYQITYGCLNEDCWSRIPNGTVFRHYYTSEVTKLPTCVEAGEKTYTCGNCSVTYDEEIAIDVNAHTWVEENQDGHTHRCSNEGCVAVKTVVGGSGTAHTLESAGSNTEVQFDDASIMIDDLSTYVASGNVNMSATTLSPEDKTNALSNIADPEIAIQISNAIGDKPIYDFGMTDEGGNPLLVEGQGKTVVVKIQYTLVDGDDPEGILIWYIADNGEVKAYEAKYYEENGVGYVTFTTDHFSKYAISVVSPEYVCAEIGHALKVVRSVEPTCYEDGYVVSICQRCGHETIETHRKRNHIHEETLRVEASCTVFGYIKYTCVHANCDNEKIVKILPTGHNFELASGTEATCANEGSVVYVCSNGVCEETYKLISGKLPHQYTKTVYDATCTENGYTEYVCLNCTEHTEGHSYTDKIVEALGHHNVSIYHVHTYDGETVTPGWTESYCSRCHDDSQNENTPDDEIVHEWNADHATCLNAKYCLICEFVEEPIDLENGHNMVNGSCSICGDGCDHEYATEFKVVDATCTENGYIAEVCELCGYENIAEILMSTGHAGDIHCTRCGHSEIDVENFFENGIDYIIGGEYAIYIEHMNVTSYMEVTMDGMEVSLGEIYLSILDNGEIYAQGNIIFTSTEEKFGFSNESESYGKFVLQDNVLYAEATQSLMDFAYSDEIFPTEATIVVGDTTYMCLNLNTIALMDDLYIGDVVSLISGEIYPSIKKAVNTGNNKHKLAEIMKIFANELFDVEKVGTDYKFVLSAEQLYRLNDDLANLSIAEFIDGRFGNLLNEALGATEGSAFENLKTKVKDIVLGSKTTVGEVLTWCNNKGINLEEVLIMMDTFTGGMYGITEEFFDEIRDISVTDFILFLVEEEEFDLEALEEIVDTYIEYFETTTIYGFVSGLMIDEETSEPVMSEEDLQLSMESMIDMITSMFDIQFTMNSQGVLKSVEVVAEVESEESSTFVDLKICFAQYYASNVDYVSMVNKIKNLKSKVVFTDNALTKLGFYTFFEIDSSFFVFDEITGALLRIEMGDPETYYMEWDFENISVTVYESCKDRIFVSVDVPYTSFDGYEFVSGVDNWYISYNPQNKDIYYLYWEFVGEYVSNRNDIHDHKDMVVISTSGSSDSCKNVLETCYYCRACQKTIIVYTKPEHNYEISVECEGEICSDGSSITHTCTVCGISQTRTFEDLYGDSYDGHLVYDYYTSENGGFVIQSCACGEYYNYQLNYGCEMEEKDPADTEYDRMLELYDGTSVAHIYTMITEGHYDCERIETTIISIYENEVLVDQFSTIRILHECQVEYRQFLFIEDRDCDIGYGQRAVCQICGRVEIDGMWNGCFAWSFGQTVSNGSVELEIFSAYCPCGEGDVFLNCLSGYMTPHEELYWVENEEEGFLLQAWEVEDYGTIAIRLGEYEISYGFQNFVCTDIFWNVSIENMGETITLEGKETIVLYSYEEYAYAN